MATALLHCCYDDNQLLLRKMLRYYAEYKVYSLDGDETLHQEPRVSLMKYHNFRPVSHPENLEIYKLNFDGGWPGGGGEHAPAKATTAF